MTAFPNKRNLYRLLHVQPDAPVDVITASYRTLLQTLKVHPDLGGDPAYASLITHAYRQLRHPTRREAYDALLLSTHDIASLSLGTVSPPRSVALDDRAPSDRQGLGATAATNARHYYRLLHVQRDAPWPIVAASARLLRNQMTPGDPEGAALREEALDALRASDARLRYDRWLLRLGHRGALRRVFPHRYFGGDTYCPFCEGKTDAHWPVRAHGASYGVPAFVVTPPVCPRCASPLIGSLAGSLIGSLAGSVTRSLPSSLASPLPSPLRPHSGATDVAIQAVANGRRRAPRAGLVEPASLQHRWHEPECPIRIIDASPYGARIETDRPLSLEEPVRLSTAHWTAVADVVYSQPLGTGFHAGLAFVTAQFERIRANFIAQSV